MTKRHQFAALAGLIVAWGGPAFLVSPAQGLLGDPERPETKWLGLLVLWLFFAIIIAVVVLWEKQPLASIGLQPVHGSSLAWGAALAVATIFLFVPIRTWVTTSLGIPGLEPGIAQVVALPLGFRIAAVVTAGVVEDTLFLGYSVERLALLTGSYLIAGALSVVASTALHMASWGISGLAFLASSAAGTAFFIWRRDLLANVISHIICDATGFVVIPLVSGSG